jgi:hypothetical protein
MQLNVAYAELKKSHKQGNNMQLTTQQTYNIASALISDKNTTIEKFETPYFCVKYIIRNNNLYLKIYAPYGSPHWDHVDKCWEINAGELMLLNKSQLVFLTYTKNNVGRAFGRTKYNPMNILTRLREPRFFKLLEMADARANGSLKTTDNQQKIQNMLISFYTRQK